MVRMYHVGVSGRVVSTALTKQHKINLLHYPRNSVFTMNPQGIRPPHSLPWNHPDSKSRTQATRDQPFTAGIRSPPLPAMPAAGPRKEMTPISMFPVCLIHEE